MSRSGLRRLPRVRRPSAAAVGLGLAVVGAVVPAVAPAGWTAPEPAAFHWGTSATGGVVDLATERVLPPAPADDGADESVTVLPYRPGARYRIPVVLGVAPELLDVEVLDVRLRTGRLSAARHARAVYSATCCTLDDAAPLAPFRLRPWVRGEGPDPSSRLVGVEVELCCVPEPVGVTGPWVEPLDGFEVTYRLRGRTRTVYRPFPFPVVVRG